MSRRNEALKINIKIRGTRSIVILKITSIRDMALRAAVANPIGNTIIKAAVGTVKKRIMRILTMIVHISRLSLELTRANQ